MSNSDWESDYRIRSRIKTVALGYVDVPKHIEGLLSVTGEDPYLLALVRYAIYRGLVTTKRVLEKNGRLKGSQRYER